MHTPGTAHPRRWWILAALCLSLLVLVIDNTILNLAIPSLMSELGGSLVMPTTMSILVTVFDAGERRKAIAAWSTVSLTGILIGPSLGGFLLDHFWWGSVFLVNVPVAAVAIAAAAWLMPESTGVAGRTDALGAVLCTVGMVAVVYAITATSEHGWGGLAPTGVLVFGLVVMAAFVLWELRTPTPMLPLRIFRKRNFTGGTFSVMLLAFAAAGMMLALTQYVQLVAGYGVLRAGLALLPFAASSAAFNMAGATLGRRFSNRTMVTTGMLVTAAGFALPWSLTPDSGYPLLGAALVIMGMGAGLATPAAVTALMCAIPPEEAGAGSAMNSTISQAGNALGVAVLGSALTAGYLSRLPTQAPATVRESLVGAVAADGPHLITAARAAFTGSMSVGMAIGAALSIAAAVLAFALLRAESDTTQAPEPAAEAASARARETI
ncbi:MFS transporter [Streptosporangium sp. NPDC003464]